MVVCGIPALAGAVIGAAGGVYVIVWCDEVCRVGCVACRARLCRGVVGI